MGLYIIKRLLQMVPLLLGISFLTFAIVNLVPNSPVDRLKLGPRIRPADVERIRENLGIGRPWPVRYVEWLGDLIRGDLGLSLVNGTPVADRIWAVLPNTLLLTTMALVLSLTVSIPLGVYSAARHNTWFDRLVTVGSTAVFAVPTFWLALLLILLFAVKFDEWGYPNLPVAGMHGRDSSGPLDLAQHMVLPTLALALPDLAGWTRFTRSSVLEIIREDYVLTARAKGLRERSVLFGHAYRNALLPLVTMVSFSLPGLFAGAFVVETIFGWNGVGRLAVGAAQDNDYPLLMGTTMMVAVLTLVANLLADVTYAALDPKIRFH